MAKELILQGKNQKLVELASLKPQTQDDISFLAIVLTAKSSSLLSFLDRAISVTSVIGFVCLLFVCYNFYMYGHVLGSFSIL